MKKQQYEYKVLRAHERDDKKYLNYRGKDFLFDTYFKTIMNYVGYDGWELVNSTVNINTNEENFYFKRLLVENITKKEDALFHEIDQYKHFSFAKQSTERDRNITDEQAAKKILEYFYPWLKAHNFKWENPAPGENESHYLVMLEDISSLKQFSKVSKKLQNITTRIDVERTKRSLNIKVSKRANDETWIETSQFNFPLNKDGLESMRYTLGYHRTWINRLNGLYKF